MGLPVPVIALDLPSYQRKENFGATRPSCRSPRAGQADGAHRPVSCNILGPTGLGFRHRDDVAEITALLEEMGIAVNVAAPMGAAPPTSPAWGPRISTCCSTPKPPNPPRAGCEKTFGQPWTKHHPHRHPRHPRLHRRGARACRARPPPDESRLRQPWWSASVDSTYLTGKRVFIFGDATHVMAAARVARDEMGFEVVRPGLLQPRIRPPDARLAKEFGLEALITDDYLEVEARDRGRLRPN
jgi:light-independent protochlorophyllide reductase subunit B